MPAPDPSVRIADLLDRLGRYLRSREHAGELNPAQWEALRYLAQANRYSLNPSALTEFLGSTRGTVSQTLIALEAKGLISREADPADRRQLRLGLTKTGRALLARDPLQELVAAAGALDPAAQRRTADGLTGLLASLQQRHGRRTFGICSACRFLQRDGAARQAGGPHRCGLTGEPLSVVDTGLICAEQEPRAA